MKTTKILQFIIPVFLCLAMVFKAYSNDIDYETEHGLLNSIYTTCLDTWCEGLFDFDFQSFNCSFGEGECLMEYAYFHKQNYFEATCTIYAESTDDLIDTWYDFELTDDLYYQLTDCIDESTSHHFDIVE